MIDIEWPFATHMDFIGQKMAERLFQIIIIFFGVIGFIAGYIMQQFSMTIYSVLFGVLISAFLTLPPWSVYRNNPVQWQTATVDSSKENRNIPTAKSSNKDARKSKAKKDE